MVREVDHLMKQQRRVAVKEELERSAVVFIFFDRIFLKICFVLLECII